MTGHFFSSPPPLSLSLSSPPHIPLPPPLLINSFDCQHKNKKPRQKCFRVSIHFLTSFKIYIDRHVAEWLERLLSDHKTQVQISPWAVSWKGDFLVSSAWESKLCTQHLLESACKQYHRFTQALLVTLGRRNFSKTLNGCVSM